MAYLGVIEAVRSRLEGNDPKYVPPYPGMPPKAGPDLRPAGATSGFSDVLMFLQRETSVNIGGKLTIPVHFGGTEGAETGNVYPSFAFEIVDYSPRYEEALYSSPTYGGERYVVPVATSTEEVFDETTSLGFSPRMARVRELEHPFDVLVEVRCYSKEPFETAALVQHIYEVLPPRHFIRIPHKDGSYRSWDLFLMSYRDLDSRAAIKMGIGGEYEGAKVFTYRVEGYFDNTDKETLINLVRTRKLSASLTTD